MYFQASHRRAEKYNNLHKKGDVKFGINKFSDLEPQEFQSILLRHQPSPDSCVLKLNSGTRKKKLWKRAIENDMENEKNMENDPLPAYVDW